MDAGWPHLADFVASIAGAVASITVAAPLDVVKVRIIYPPRPPRPPTTDSRFPRLNRPGYKTPTSAPK
jgi:hypothetical protein